MKVGDTAGTARILPLHAVQTALRGAWGRSYSDISEIAPNVFMAHFQDARALHFVWMRQPWVVGKEVLLMEWVNPDAKAKPLQSYRFAKLYVTVRFYGIPHSLRRVPDVVDTLVKPLLRAVGAPSDLDQLSEAAMFRDSRYVAARAKIDVTKKMVDRVKLDLKNSESVTAYVFYERISRICTFYGLMFHNYTDCTQRNQLILQQSSDSENDHLIPHAIYGQWMTNEKLIPENHEEIKQLQPTNQMIQRFVQYFSKLTVAGSSLEPTLEMGKKSQPPQQLLQSMPVHSSQETSLLRYGDATAQSGQRHGQRSGQRDGQSPNLQQLSKPQQQQVVPSSAAQIKLTAQTVPQHVLQEKASPALTDPQGDQGTRSKRHFQPSPSTGSPLVGTIEPKQLLHLPPCTGNSSPRRATLPDSERQLRHHGREAEPKTNKRSKPCHSSNFPPPPSKRVAVAQDGELNHPCWRRSPSPALSSTSDAASHRPTSPRGVELIGDALLVPVSQLPTIHPAATYIPPHRRHVITADRAYSQLPLPYPIASGSNSGDRRRGARSGTRASRWDRGPNHREGANNQDVSNCQESRGGPLCSTGNTHAEAMAPASRAPPQP